MASKITSVATGEAYGFDDIYDKAEYDEKTGKSKKKCCRKLIDPVNQETFIVRHKCKRLNPKKKPYKYEQPKSYCKQ